MVYEIKESDWKLLRRLHQVALERFCRHVIEEISAATSDRAGDYHECFLKVFALVNERNRELARTFDDLRRSNAVILLASLMEERLLSEEEFSRFGPETRDAVEAILRVRGAAQYPGKE
jgi:hypothetical protein